MTGRWLGLAALLVSASLVAAWAARREAPPVEVGVATVGVGDISAELVATGAVAAARELSLAAPVSGMLAVLDVLPGQTVEAGTQVAGFELVDVRASLQQAQAEVARTESLLSQAHIRLQASRTLFEAGGEAGDKVAELAHQVSLAQAARQSAVAGVRAVQARLEAHRLHAPFSGVVVKVHAGVGQYVAAGTPLLTLADLAHREVEIEVDAVDAASLRVDQEATISAASHPERTWEGRILRMSPSVGQSNTVTVRLRLKGDAQGLRLGEQADVRLVLARKAQALKLPAGSLRSRDGRTAVAVVDADGVVHWRDVAIGIEDVAHVEVLSGLKAGERVVTPASAEVREGQKVTAREAGKT